MPEETPIETYARAVDEMRRLHRVCRRPPNAHEAKAIREAEAKVDALTPIYLPADVMAEHPAQG